MNSISYKTAKGFLQRLLIVMVVLDSLCLLYLYQGNEWVQARRWFYLSLANYTALVITIIYDIVVPTLRHKREE